MYQNNAQNFNNNATSSIGSIMQNFYNGSFVSGGGNTIKNANYQMSRDSVNTPFMYDENSLMNLSNTPSMIRTSKLTRKQDERIISSTKINGKHNSVMN